MLAAKLIKVRARVLFDYLSQIKTWDIEIDDPLLLLLLYKLNILEEQYPAVPPQGIYDAFYDMALSNMPSETIDAAVDACKSYIDLPSSKKNTLSEINVSRALQYQEIFDLFHQKKISLEESSLFTEEEEIKFQTASQDPELYGFWIEGKLTFLELGLALERKKILFEKYPGLLDENFHKGFILADLSYSYPSFAEIFANGIISEDLWNTIQRLPLRERFKVLEAMETLLKADPQLKQNIEQKIISDYYLYQLAKEEMRKRIHRTSPMHVTPNRFFGGLTVDVDEESLMPAEEKRPPYVSSFISWKR